MSQQINLFNPIFLKQKKYFSAVTMAQALGLLLLGSIAMGIYTDNQVSRLSKDAAATTAQLGAIQTELATLTATSGSRQKSKLLEDEVQKTEADVKSLQQGIGVLQKGDLGNTKGYAEYLRAFSRQIVTGVWLTGFNIYGAGSEIGIQGRALQPELVPAFITRLKREPVLQGKSFSALSMQTSVIEPIKKSDTSSAKATAQTAFIEFNLQSYVAGNDKAEVPGAKSK